MVASHRVHGKHFMREISEVCIIPMYRHDPYSMFLRVGDPFEKLG
jgi:hypothetical protein